MALCLNKQEKACSPWDVFAPVLGGEEHQLISEFVGEQVLNESGSVMRNLKPTL
jgi:hypothetical protein